MLINYQMESQIFLNRLVNNLEIANKFISSDQKLRGKEWLYINNRNKEKFLKTDNIKNFRANNVWLSEGMDTYGMREEFVSKPNVTALLNYFKNKTFHPKYLLSDHFNLDEKNKTEKSKFTFEFYNKKSATTRLHEMINECSEKFVLQNLVKKNIGNSPMAYQYKDVFYDEYNLCHLKYFFDLNKMVFNNHNNPQTVLEIGGGFGILADYITKNHNLKYISFDLPEANLLTSWYLHQSQPQKKLFLIDDYIKTNVIDDQILKNYDIFILPPNINLKSDLKIDLFINIRSMMEMEFDVVKNYFNLIHKHISENGYFYNINRYVSNRKLFNLQDYAEIGASDLAEYPYDNNWDVLMSENSYRHSHVHTLLTQRKEREFKNNIKNELKNIKNISKSFNPNSFRMKIKKIRIKTKNWLIFLLMIFLRKFFSRKIETSALNFLIKIKRFIFIRK